MTCPINICPIPYSELKKKWFLGLVSVNWYIEDRRPDCSEEEYPTKYKNHLTVRVGWLKLSWVFRTYWPCSEIYVGSIFSDSSRVLQSDLLNENEHP